MHQNSWTKKELKGRIDNSTIIVGDFNSPFSIINSKTR